jgi:signal transduction histidine kinase
MDVEPLFKQICEATEAYGAQRSMKVNLTHELKDEVVCDSVMITGTLHTLLSNALKYTNGTGKAINVRTWGEGDMWNFSIEDQGIGMTEAERIQLFGGGMFRGETAKKEGKKGAGLGLALAFRSVRRIGGDIKVTSEVGKGTTFTVTMPKQPVLATT